MDANHMATVLAVFSRKALPTVAILRKDLPKSGFTHPCQQPSKDMATHPRMHPSLFRWHPSDSLFHQRRSPALSRQTASPTCHRSAFPLAEGRSRWLSHRRWQPTAPWTADPLSRPTTPTLRNRARPLLRPQRTKHRTPLNSSLTANPLTTRPPPPTRPKPPKALQTLTPSHRSTNTSPRCPAPTPAPRPATHPRPVKARTWRTTRAPRRCLLQVAQPPARPAAIRRTTRPRRRRCRDGDSNPLLWREPARGMMQMGFIAE